MLGVGFAFPLYFNSRWFVGVDGVYLLAFVFFSGVTPGFYMKGCCDGE